MNYLRQFQYNEQIIGDYIDLLIERPDSPEQVKNLLSHILNAIAIWVGRVEQKDPGVDVWQVHAPDAMHQLNRSFHAMVFDLLERGNLRKVHPYTNSKGDKFSNSLDEILTHLIIHSAHHRAQISTMWRTEGIDPPVCDFIFWARKTSSL